MNIPTAATAQTISDLNAQLRQSTSKAATMNMLGKRPIATKPQYLSQTRQADNSPAAQEICADKLKQKLPKNLQVCADILKVLFSKEASIYGWPFYQPIDAEFYGLLDYRDKIKNPMDLSTVKTKLEHLLYKNVTEFAADIRLMFKNCYKYFHPNHDIILMGRELEKLFDIQMNNLPAEREVGDAESKGDKDGEISFNPLVDDIEELIKHLKGRAKL